MTSKIFSRRGLSRNKKGNLPDIALIVVVLFAFAIAATFGKVVIDEMNDNLANKSSIPNSTKSVLSGAQGSYNSLVDGAFLFAMVITFIGIVISAFFIRSHPIFFVIGIIFMIFLLFVSMVLQDTWQEMTSKTILGSRAAEFTIIDFILGNLPYVVVIIGFTIIIVLYAKTRL